MSGLKQGDKFLLPVAFKAYMGPPSGIGNRHAWLTMDNGRVLQAYAPEIHTLIPANRLTDLEAENARLREALRAMVDEKCDYMLINQLGNPEDTHTVKHARAALNTGDNQ